MADTHRFTGIFLSSALLLTSATSLALLFWERHGEEHMPKPDASPVTRAHAVTMLLSTQLEILPYVENTGEYPDILPGLWFEQFMLAGAHLGVIKPHPVTGELKPQEPVTRAEFLRLLSYAFDVTTGGPTQYSDVGEGTWYAPFAGLAEEYDLFPGDTDKSILQPRSILTEREMMTAIRRFFRTQEHRPFHVWHLHEAPREPEQGFSIDFRTETVTETIDSAIREREARMISPFVLGEEADVLPELRGEVLDLVNAVRNEHGLEPLKYNALLEQSAQAYAEQMAQQRFFSHIAPDGRKLKDRVRASGYYNDSLSLDCLCIKRVLLGENLVRRVKTPRGAVDAWMASPGHRKIILSPQYAETGIGVVEGMYVQHFGSVSKPVGME